jgi:molecular chaperone GrpE
MPEDLKIEELKKQLEECQKKSKEYLAGWQRARADFLNYKKEEMERIEQLIKYANLEMILNILPVLDNFQKAEQELSEEQKKDGLLQGFLQMKNQLRDFLKSQGVEEIKALNEKFDPNFHEATEQVEAKDKECETVIEEIQKGYTISGQLLRPAKVKIAK